MSEVAVLRNYGMLERKRVQSGSGKAFWEVDAHADLGSEDYRKRYWITKHWRSGWNRNRFVSFKCNASDRFLFNARGIGWDGNGGRADYERR